MAASYLVGREKLREYAAAIGERSPLCHDVEAARAAGHADVVAPPMFAAVYSWMALEPLVLDPASGIDYTRLVHGGQDFIWHAPVVAGDELTTSAELSDRAERAGMKYFTFTTRSRNQRDELVCEGTWLIIVR